MVVAQSTAFRYNTNNVRATGGSWGPYGYRCEMVAVNDTDITAAFGETVYVPFCKDRVSENNLQLALGLGLGLGVPLLLICLCCLCFGRERMTRTVSRTFTRARRETLVEPYFQDAELCQAFKHGTFNEPVVEIIRVMGSEQKQDLIKYTLDRHGRSKAEELEIKLLTSTT